MPLKKSISFDLQFFLISLGLVIFGLIMLTSASGPVGYENFQDSYYFLKHQIFFGLIPGLIGMFFFLRAPIQIMKRYAFHALVFSIVLLLLVFIPGIGSDFGTSHSWISFGSIFSLQPAEVVKLTFLFYLAAWLEKRVGVVKDFSDGLIPFLISLGIVLFLIALQPDTGTMAVIGAMSFIVYFVAGAPIIHLAGIGAIGAFFLFLLVKSSTYRADRFTAFLHPELDPLGVGYHINQALLAIGSGGIFGVGYGLSRQKFEYLPEVVGDSVFAVIAEEMGFIITSGLVALFVFFLWRGIKIAKEAPDAFQKYMVVGIVSWITVQAFMNIGSMTSLMPMTGVTLPFVSYGGTSLAICMSAVGVILNVSRSRSAS